MNDRARIDVIVVGAGAAGLLAARDLAQFGLRVVVLEARSRVGGRILTRRPTDSAPIELGPEFVHGDNPLLWELTRQAGAVTAESTDLQWVLTDAGLERRDQLWDRMGRVFKMLQPELYPSLGAWLDAGHHDLPAQDAVLLREFVQDFHAAPLHRMSALTLKTGAGGTQENQHRLINGYDRVPFALAEQCKALGVEIHLDVPVSQIAWRAGEVEVFAQTEKGQGGAAWRARAAVITVPLGVLKAQPSERGGLRFQPELPAKQLLWARLEMGVVFRLVLRFNSTFWRDTLAPEKLRAGEGSEFGYVHAPGAPVPVWWSLAPQPILVGWGGGPAAEAMTGKSHAEAAAIALRTLADLFNCELSALSSALVEADWHDWTSDPYCRGGYCYSTSGQEDAQGRLAEAVEATLFFAGEATADAMELGTVGGALSSGARAAAEVAQALLAKTGETART